jgi:hypothetical protein
LRHALALGAATLLVTACSTLLSISPDDPAPGTPDRSDAGGEGGGADADATSDACLDGACAAVSCNEAGMSTACAAPSGGFACVDTTKDPKNCGSCGNVCGPGSPCVNGDCERVAFVTASVYVPMTGFTSVADADAVCTKIALSKGRARPFKAWLSDATTSPTLRFVHGKSSYRSMTGALIANDFTDLTSGTLRNPIEVDENGTVAASGPAWTSTTAMGALVGATHCSGWTTSAGFGIVGDVAAKTGDWSYTGTPLACTEAAHLYCFEQ